MVAVDGVPSDAAGANAFLAAHATPVEIHAAHATPAAHRDLWIKAILRIVGPITGPEAMRPPSSGPCMVPTRCKC